MAETSAQFLHKNGQAIMRGGPFYLKNGSNLGANRYLAPIYLHHR
jgi:hypothetical protein